MTIFCNISEKSLKKYFLKVGQFFAVFKMYYFTKFQLCLKYKVYTYSEKSEFYLIGFLCY